MKHFLTLVLCWLLAFETLAATTVKIKTAQSVAGGYVTSLNKVDGSFEDGTTGWVASVGTITASASTEFQGNFKGVWAGTGTGTLDLQWTATASNTYEASMQFRSPVADSDHYICAYVGTTETGCALVDGPDYTPNTIRKISVVANSVMSSAFYLRLKHTGSGAFSADIDDGKIEPYTPSVVNLVEQESVSYTGYSSGTNPVVFKTKDTLRSNEKNLIAVSTVGSAETASRYTVLKPLNYVVSTSLDYSASGTNYTTIMHYDSSGNKKKGPANYGTLNDGSITLTGKAEVGDYFIVQTNATIVDNSATHFSITATAISSNVIQSYSDDRVGETIYSIQSTPPNGFISAQGSVLGLSSGTHQGETYKALYKYAWNIATTTSTDPYYISSAKGASADADWIAGKTIKIDESGLFTRAYLAGTTGAVGVKQLDAMQGHRHQIFLQDGTRLNRADTIGYGGVSGIGYASGFSAYPYAGNLETDGTNGDPRTASETRPINVAKYAYIRYAQSMPTLLALPTRSEVFSSNISASGVVSNATQNFVTSCTNAVPSVCSLWSSFGVAPICWAHTLDITKRAEVTAVTATTTTVARTDTSTAFNLFCHLK